MPRQKRNCESDYDEIDDRERGGVDDDEDKDESMEPVSGERRGREQTSTELSAIPVAQVDKEELESRKQEILKYVDDPNKAEDIAQDQLTKEKRAGQQIYLNSIEDRPSNTTRTYQPSKIAFVKWCKENGYHDEEVSEGRVVRFLTEEFVDKPEREGEPHKSYNTLVVYVSGLIDLYKQQKMEGEISPGNLGVRGNGLTKVQCFMDMYRRREAGFNHKSFVDRSRNDMDDGYSSEEFAQLMDDTLKDDNAQSLQKRLHLLLREVLLFRGDSTRDIELCDMSVRVQETDDPTPLTMLSILPQKAKKNRTDYVGAVQHADPKLCILNAIARLLFYRFQMTKEGFPDLSSRKAWYDVKLLVSYLKKNARLNKKGELIKANAPESCTRAVATATQDRWTSKLYKKSNVHRSRKKHNRGSGGRHALQAGVDVNDIGRQDDWAVSAVNKHYLYDDPHTILRVQAGFKRDVGSYYIPRAAIDPPDELLQQVFPGIETMLSEVTMRQWKEDKADKTPEELKCTGEGQKASRANDLQCQDMTQVASKTALEKQRLSTDNPGPISKGKQTDECAVGFLKLLLHLRRVLLQDMAIMCQQYPADPLLKHPIFKSESFRTFAVKVREAHNEPFEKAPVSARMSLVLPEVSQNFDGIKKSLSAVVRQLYDHQNQQQMKHDALESKIDENFSKGRQQLREDNFTLWKESEKSLRDAIYSSMKQIKEQVVTEVIRDLTNGHVNFNNQKRKCNRQNDGPPHKKPRPPADEPQEEFKMQRNDDDIFHLWDEWKSRTPNVEYMEQTYGAKWRKDAADTRFYTRRKVIIDAVEEVMKSGNKTSDEVLKEAHEFQQSLSKPTLNKLSMVISEKKKQNGAFYHPFMH